jgi:hypothetical protein
VLAKFSDGILNYVANIEQAPDKTVTLSRFSQQVYSAFEVLFNVWILSKEAKLRIAVVEALGIMSQLLTKEKLETVGRVCGAVVHVWGRLVNFLSVCVAAVGTAVVASSGPRHAGALQEAPDGHSAHHECWFFVFGFNGPLCSTSVMKGLCAVLQAAVTNDSEVLAGQLDLILQVGGIQISFSLTCRFMLSFADAVPACPASAQFFGPGHSQAVQ